MLGDDTARVVVFVKPFQPLVAYRSYHPETVTRYVTQVKTNGSKTPTLVSSATEPRRAAGRKSLVVFSFDDVRDLFPPLSFVRC